MKHIEFAIATVRGRSSSPPGSMKYWLQSTEKILIDFEAEWESAKANSLMRVETRVGSGPISTHQSQKRKVVGR
jgi:hypothetical protein